MPVGLALVQTTNLVLATEEIMKTVGYEGKARDPGARGAAQGRVPLAHHALGAECTSEIRFTQREVLVA